MKAPGHKHIAKGKDGKHHRQGKDQAMRGNRNGNKANAQGRKGNKPNCTNGTCKQNPAQQNATADGSYYIDNGLIKVFPIRLSDKQQQQNRIIFPRKVIETSVFPEKG